MDSSIVISELAGLDKGYNFKVSGILYTEDITALGREIKSKLKSENDINEIQVDIGDIDPSSFYKSNRFLGLCTRLSNEYKDTRFRVIMHERLSQSFPEYDLGQPFELTKIKDEPMTDVNYNLTSNNNLKFLIDLVLKKDIRSLVLSSIKKRVDTFFIPNKTKRHILIYVVGIIASFLYFQKTVFGYALFLSCSILLIESALYLRIYNRNLKSESIIDHEEASDFEFITDNDEVPMELLSYKSFCEK